MVPVFEEDKNILVSAQEPLDACNAHVTQWGGGINKQYNMHILCTFSYSNL